MQRIQNTEKCPTCGNHTAKAHFKDRFSYDMLRFIREQRIVKLDSCTICVKKHVARAMIYYEELLSANGSGTASGTAAVNVPMNHLKIIGHLGCAIEESEDFPELFELLLQSERDYRYEGICPDWETIAQKISDVEKLQQSKN